MYHRPHNSRQQYCTVEGYVRYSSQKKAGGRRVASALCPLEEEEDEANLIFFGRLVPLLSLLPSKLFYETVHSSAAKGGRKYREGGKLLLPLLLLREQEQTLF